MSIIRWSRVRTQIWKDEKFRVFDDDTRLLFFYLITSPHSSSIGFYYLPLSYAAEDLKWPLNKLNKPMKTLIDLNIITYDYENQLMLINNHFKHNPLENHNQAKWAGKIINSLPQSPLFDCFYQLIKPFHKPFMQQLFEAVEERIAGSPARAPAEPVPPKPEKEKPPKIKYGEFKNVLLTEEELNKLISGWGSETFQKRLAEFSKGKAAGGYKYASDYAALLKWKWEDTPHHTQSPTEAAIAKLKAKEGA